MASKEEMEFTSNPAHYNRVRCGTCQAAVKVHHMRKHLAGHGFGLAEYRSVYGQEWDYVKKLHHRCGICEKPLLFDLDSLYCHLTASHQVKVKEYVELYIGPIGAISKPIPAPTPTAVYRPPVPSKQAVKRGRPKGSKTKAKVKPEVEVYEVPKTSKASPSSKAKVRKVEEVFIPPSGHKAVGPERETSYHEDGCLISNDQADYVLVECGLCGLHTPMTRLRSHTKSAHGINITEYKAEFGSDLVPIEMIWHRCAICSQFLMLDNDEVAKHLKKPGHNISHKNYNDCFMAYTSRTRRTHKNFSNSYNSPSMTPLPVSSSSARLVTEEDQSYIKTEPTRVKSETAQWRESTETKQSVTQVFTHQQLLKMELEELRTAPRSRSVRKKSKISYEEDNFDIAQILQPNENAESEDNMAIAEVVMENGEEDVGLVKSLHLGRTNRQLNVIMLDDSAESVEDIPAEGTPEMSNPLEEENTTEAATQEEPNDYETKQNAPSLMSFGNDGSFGVFVDC